MEFFTIGVYNSNEQTFFEKLTSHGIDTFCDIRQRRGVRGAKYSFVNSNRLQKKLGEIGIKYQYISELAPTTEIRELQKAVDIEKREAKRERQVLGEVFSTEYQKRILNKFDFQQFFKSLDGISAKRIVLFCVEEYPDACHRSIVTDKLKKYYDYKVTHL